MGVNPYLPAAATTDKISEQYRFAFSVAYGISMMFAFGLLAFVVFIFYRLDPLLRGTGTSIPTYNILTIVLVILVAVGFYLSAVNLRKRRLKTALFLISVTITILLGGPYILFGLCYGFSLEVGFSFTSLLQVRDGG